MRGLLGSAVIGWAVGLVVALAVAQAVSFAFGLTSTAAFLVGLACGFGFSQAGLLIGLARWSR